MKAHKKLCIAIALLSLSCLAMEDSKLENLTHEELAKKQNALAVNYIVELIKDGTLHSLIDQGFTRDQFAKLDGIFVAFENTLAEPMLEEHMLLPDDKLRDLISAYSDTKIIDIEREFTCFPATLQRHYDLLMTTKDELFMPDLPTDSLALRIQAYEQLILEASNEIDPLILRNCLFLFDQSIRKKFPQGVDSYNLLFSVRSEELEIRIGEMMKKYKPALEKQVQGEAIKILMKHWSSKSKPNHL